MAPRRGWGWRRRRPTTALVLLITTAVVLSCLLGGYASVGTYTPAKTHCPVEGGNFSAGSMYQANIDGLLHSFRDGAATNAGFVNTTFGVPNDEVWGVAMCFADVSWTDCKKCLDRAPSYMMSTACPSGRTGALLYNECLLRYSDEYFATMQTDTDQAPFGMYVTAYVGDMVSMNSTRWKMMDRLIAEAAASPLRYALDNNETYTDPTTGTHVYGLVQCRRDLTTEECTKCLSYLVGLLLDMFPNNTAAYLKGFSCFAKYHPEPIALIMVPSGAPEVPPAEDDRYPKANTMSLIVGLGVAAAASGILFLSTLGVLLWLVFGMWKRRFAIASAADEDMEGRFRNGAGPIGFSYDVLAAATSNFSDDQKLGEGGFGSVYKGFLDQLNMYVAIKRSKSSSEGRKEYASEVTIISQLRHRNLVKLIGWCHSHDHHLLVYEFMPNGSLDRHLYTADNILSWKRRYDIILGIGSALLYLHQDCEQGVLHRDIKPSNVMLDAAFNPKLGDFGLARLVDHGRGAHTTELAGTMGYMDPECMSTGRFSTESDMYAFGVVLLEVACGRRPVVVVQGENENTVVHLARRVREMHGRGEVLDAADPRLDDHFDARQMERVLVVGLWCTAHDRNLRPSIWQAVRALRFESSVPTVTNGQEPTPVARLASVPSSSFRSEDEDMTTRSMHAALDLGPPTNYYSS